MQQINLFETPEITDINRLPMGGAPIAEEERFYLDGQWDFKLFSSPAEINGFDHIQWDKITVPSNWTLGGFGDLPIYTNITMPFDNVPPLVPAENPTGVYRKIFTLPENFRSKRLVLHIGGAESYLEVTLNGKFVGMGKDTRLPSEFDLTPFVQEGENVLICKVIRFSDSSYIEDQDQWWMAGIYRSCYIYTTSDIFFDDIFVNGDWDWEKQLGSLTFHCHISFNPPVFYPQFGPQEDFTVKYCIFDRQNREVAADRGKISRHFNRGNYCWQSELKELDVEAWSSETPVLYTCVAELFNSEDILLDRRTMNCGFRNVQVKDSSLLINGKRVMIKGVNRHEHDCRTGKTLSLESMMEDIRLLKQFNFNAVRTCHYPDDERWYDLCDRFGIYLMDEANVESHANYHTLCRDPRWKNAMVSRFERMVLRDRSHVSIIAWSPGNESGNGENIAAAIDRIRELDNSRIIFHNGELAQAWNQGSGYNWGGESDRYNQVFCPMYTDIETLREYDNTPEALRPVILIEYAHAMGNSSGSLCDYWDLFYSGKKMQGGFIWDWVDQGLLKTAGNGEEFFAYGGDFGEKVHDSDFCCNGMLASDRSPHPAMYEFRHLVQDIKVKHIEKNSFRITSYRDFTTLADFSGEWSLEKNGVAIAGGSIDGFQSLEPGKSMDFTPPLPENLCRREDEELFINFKFTFSGDSELIPPGTLLAHDQFDLTGLYPAFSPAEVPVSTAVVSAVKQDDKFILTCGLQQLIFDRNTLKTSLYHAGICLGEDLFDGCFFRAPTDNDGIKGKENQSWKPFYKWLVNNLHKLQKHLNKVELSDNSLTLLFDYVSETGKITMEQTFTASPEGSFAVRNHFEVPEEWLPLPRIGVVSRFNKLGKFSWFGRGPWENYIDRNRAAEVGLYSSDVEQNSIFNYAVPQENNNRTDTRKLILHDENYQLTVSGEPRFEFGVSHYTIADLHAAPHAYQLTPLPETIVTLDLKQRGLGTGSCGPQTLEQYELKEKEYDFSFSFKVEKSSSEEFEK